MSAGPGGSRLTIMLSGAARGASRTIRDKMIRIAAHAMEMSPDDVECVDGALRAEGGAGHVDERWATSRCAPICSSTTTRRASPAGW